MASRWRLEDTNPKTGTSIRAFPNFAHGKSATSCLVNGKQRIINGKFRLLLTSPYSTKSTPPSTASAYESSGIQRYGKSLMFLMIYMVGICHWLWFWSESGAGLL